MGRATDLLQVPTRFLMARSARRRRLVFAIVGAVGVAAAVGTAGAFFALDSAKVGSLHREWATFQGCMLGEGLKAGEEPSHRYRLQLLSQLATPPEKRPLSDGKACTFSLHPTLYFSATASSPFPSPAIPTVLSDATLVSVCGLWPRWYDHCETTGDCVDHWLPES